MIEIYKLMNGKYDHVIADFMRKEHDSISSLPTQGHHMNPYKQKAEKNLYVCVFWVKSYWNSRLNCIV